MQKQLTNITIPEGLKFESLSLGRDADTGDVSFDWDPINQICEASGIDPAIFTDQTEDNVAGLIVQWYSEALKNGEPRDATADDLLNEIIAEDALGGGLSHKPGTA